MTQEAVPTGGRSLEKGLQRPPPPAPCMGPLATYMQASCGGMSMPTELPSHCSPLAGGLEKALTACTNVAPQTTTLHIHGDHMRMRWTLVPRNIAWAAGPRCSGLRGGATVAFVMDRWNCLIRGWHQPPLPVPLVLPPLLVVLCRVC